MSRTGFGLIILAGVVAIFVILQLVSKRNPQEKISSAKTFDKYELWHSFSPQSQSFETRVPMPPRHSSHQSYNIIDKYPRHYNFYVSEQLDATIYFIQEVTFDRSIVPLNDPTLIDEAITEMMASNGNNQLISKEQTKFQGFPAVKFYIENEGDFIVGIGFVTKRALYMLTRVSKKRKQSDEDFNYFLNHFNVNESPKG